MENIKKGLVSVIIPTYNRAGMVSRVLDSVWNQTYRPIELLVVNDGSLDNTETVVSTWISTHGDIQNFTAQLLTQKNAGGCAARNNGLNNAHGEFIQFFDDDDELCPTTIKTHVDNLNAHPDILSSLAQSTYVSPKVSVNTSYRLGQWDSKTDFVELLKDLPSPSYILFRHEYLLQNHIIWDTTLPCGQDTDFMIRTLIIGNTFFCLDHISSKIFIHPGEHVSNRLHAFSVDNLRKLLDKWFQTADGSGINDDFLKEGLSYLIFSTLRRNAKTGTSEKHAQLCKLAEEYGCDKLPQIQFAQNHSFGIFQARLLLIRLLNRMKIFGKFD